MMVYRFYAAALFTLLTAVAIVNGAMMARGVSALSFSVCLLMVPGAFGVAELLLRGFSGRDT